MQFAKKILNFCRNNVINFLEIFPRQYYYRGAARSSGNTPEVVSDVSDLRSVSIVDASRDSQGATTELPRGGGGRLQGLQGLQV